MTPWQIFAAWTALDLIGFAAWVLVGLRVTDWHAEAEAERDGVFHGAGRDARAVGGEGRGVVINHFGDVSK